jgi:ribosomal protein S18 acetylase RimI-like enzyme
MSGKLVEPTREEILAFCAVDPVERVFLEDVARRGNGRFIATRGEDGSLRGLCHLGTNIVPSGDGCAAFAGVAAKVSPRMLIGEERAVSELWEAGQRRFGAAREDRPGQPVYEMRVAPEPGHSGLRPATLDDLDFLLPACAAAHAEELGIDPLVRDAPSYRWRTRVQIEEGRSWLWDEGGQIRFKAEASAWTPTAVQLQQVWVDPPARRQGQAARGLRDLARLLLRDAEVICLFVRRENEAAIRLYESIGMQRVLSYRSVLLCGN